MREAHSYLSFWMLNSTHAIKNPNVRYTHGKFLKTPNVGAKRIVICLTGC